MYSTANLLCKKASIPCSTNFNLASRKPIKFKLFSSFSCIQYFQLTACSIRDYILIQSCKDILLICHRCSSLVPRMGSFLRSLVVLLLVASKLQYETSQDIFSVYQNHTNSFTFNIRVYTIKGLQPMHAECGIRSGGVRGGVIQF